MSVITGLLWKDQQLQRAPSSLLLLLFLLSLTKPFFSSLLHSESDQCTPHCTESSKNPVVDSCGSAYTHTPTHRRNFRVNSMKMPPHRVETILSPSENAHWPVSSLSFFLSSLSFVWGTHSQIPSLTNTSWRRCCETTEKAPFWVYKHTCAYTLNKLRKECAVKVAKWLKCGLSAGADGIRINSTQSFLLQTPFQAWRSTMR